MSKLEAATILTVVLISLKLEDVINVSWWFALSPVPSLFIASFVVDILTWMYDKLNERSK